MDAIKAFFAKDVVKLIMGSILALASGLVALYVKDVNLKVSILGIIAGIGAFLGIQSGGTSSLRSDAANSTTAELQDRGVVAAPPPKA